jgi:hypothetical protein
MVLTHAKPITSWCTSLTFQAAMLASQAPVKALAKNRALSLTLRVEGSTLGKEGRATEGLCAGFS